MILKFLENNKQKREEIVGKFDDEGLTTYLMATICNFPEAQQLLAHPIFLEHEFFLVKTGDITPVMNAAFFGRPFLAEFIYRMSTAQSYRENTYKMLLQRDDSGSCCLELAQAEVDFAKFGCTQSDKINVYKWLKRGVLDALEFASAHATDFVYKELRDGFLQGQTIDALLLKVETGSALLGYKTIDVGDLKLSAATNVGGLATKEVEKALS